MICCDGSFHVWTWPAHRVSRPGVTFGCVCKSVFRWVSVWISQLNKIQCEWALSHRLRAWTEQKARKKVFTPFPSSLLDLRHLPLSSPAPGRGLTPPVPWFSGFGTHTRITSLAFLSLLLRIWTLLGLFFWKILPNTNVNEYSTFWGQNRCINFELNKAESSTGLIILGLFSATNTVYCLEGR